VPAYSGRDLFPALRSCRFDCELQLDGNLGVLFPPEYEECRRQPASLSPKFVDNGMASRTECDQPGRGVTATSAVMDDTLIRCPASLAAVGVAGKDGFAMTAKASARVRRPAIATTAQSQAEQLAAAAAVTKEVGLGGFQLGSV